MLLFNAGAAEYRDILVGGATGIGVAVASFTLGDAFDAELLSAALAVAWRAEDLFPLPSWASWAVFFGLLAVLIVEVVR